MSRIGVMGGTFDPIHAGHLAAAMAAMECAHLDRVILVPSALPPHRGPALAPDEDRLAMCRLAAEELGGKARLEVSDVEVRRGGRSYTADTLRELNGTHPGDELFLILGWDAARLFNTWREPELVSALASIVVVARPGLETPVASELAGAGLGSERVIRCFVETPDISGSELRGAIAAGRPVTGKLPASVERYITGHHLYLDNRPVGT